MYERHETGKIGENIAVSYLEKIGYKIIDRNFECRQGEIDIVALDNDIIVFIEVKTRASALYGLPKEAVNVIMKLRYIWAGPETAAGGDSMAEISAYLFFCAFPLKRI